MDSLNVLTATAETVTDTNLLAIAAKGGILMIVLLLISIVAISIIIERLLKIKRTRINEDDFMQEIYGYLAEDQIDKAIMTCENRKNSPIAAILSKTINLIESGFGEIQEVVQMAVRKEIKQLEKNLGALATFAAIAPLIGFLGTVTGMVKVFMKIGETGGGVDISLLANGIWEALITTIGGLTVGIISILFYNYLVGKIEELSQNFEENISDFILMIKGIKK